LRAIQKTTKIYKCYNARYCNFTRGELLCGDLFMNYKKPNKTSLVDRKEDLNASIEKLRHFEIGTVYPGHGKPFLLEDFFTENKI